MALDYTLPESTFFQKSTRTHAAAKDVGLFEGSEVLPYENTISPRLPELPRNMWGPTKSLKLGESPIGCKSLTHVVTTWWFSEELWGLSNSEGAPSSPLPPVVIVLTHSAGKIHMYVWIHFSSGPGSFTYNLSRKGCTLERLYTLTPHAATGTGRHDDAQ